MHEVIDRSSGWGYFDGAYQGNLDMGGASGIIYQADNLWTKFQVAL